MGAFDNAWTLLKNRGFEVDPRYEDERERRLQGAYDDIDTVKDNRERVLAELHRLSQRRRPEEEAMFNQVMGGGLPNSPRGPDLRHTGGYPGGGLDQSEHELTSLLDPEGRRGQGSPYLSIPEMESQLGPMYRHQQNQEAERIEAEGIQLPDTPSTVNFEDDYPDRSTAPPADIGRAGSSIPPGRGYEPKFLFNPFAPGAKSFDYQFDPVGQQPPRDGLKEYSESLEQTPLGQALTQARSQPPQPLQFEKAWATLKADPNMLDAQGRSIPPAIFNITNHPYRGISDVEGVYRTPRPSAYHFLQDADEEEEQTMRQNERRFGPLGSILAQDTDKGREFYQYRGPDVSDMYAPVPQPE